MNDLFSEGIRVLVHTEPLRVSRLTIDGIHCEGTVISREEHSKKYLRERSIDMDETLLPENWIPVRLDFPHDDCYVWGFHPNMLKIIT